MLYPNPTKGVFNLEFDGKFDSEIAIEIRSISGQLIKKKVINQANFGNRYSIDILNEANGIYFIQIREKDFVKTIKFNKM